MPYAGKVADLMEISVSYFSDIELAKRRPPALELVECHARALEVDAGQLIELAQTSREVVELPIKGIESTSKGKLALVLARRWNGLTQAEALDLLQRVNGLLG